MERYTYKDMYAVRLPAHFAFTFIGCFRRQAGFRSNRRERIAPLQRRCGAQNITFEFDDLASYKRFYVRGLWARSIFGHGKRDTTKKLCPVSLLCCMSPGKCWCYRVFSSCLILPTIKACVCFLRPCKMHPAKPWQYSDYSRWQGGAFLSMRW